MKALGMGRERTGLRAFMVSALLGGLSVAALAFPAFSQAQIYWSNSGSNSGAGTGTTIGTSTNDGSGVDQVFITTSIYPRGVAADATHVYWSAGENATARIGRVGVDGTGPDLNLVEPNDCEDVDQLRQPFGIAIDSTHIYWAELLSGLVGRATLDGTSVVCDWFSPPNPGYTVERDIAVDDQYLYWTQTEVNVDPFIPGKIGRVEKSDTASPDASFISGIGSVGSVAVNETHIFWGRRFLPGGISRMPIDGSGSPQAVLADGFGVSGVGLTRDFVYYVTNANSAVVGRVGIDAVSGSGQQLVSGVDRGFFLAVTSPEGSLTPTSHDFGQAEIEAADPASRTFTLASAGDAPLTIDADGIGLTGVDPSDFRLSGGTCEAGTTTLANGETCTIEVAFEPTSTGAKAATLEVATNAEPFTASLTGEGIAPAGTLSPASHDFGQAEIEAADPASRTFTLTSTGDAPLTIDTDGIGLTGVDPSDFRLSGGTCQTGTTTLANGETCTVQVAFEPSSVGAKSATLQIATNDGPFTSSLSGTGIRTPDPGPEPSPSFTALRLTSKAKRVKAPRRGKKKVAVTVRVTNSGDADGTATVRLRSSSRKVKVPRQVRVQVPANASATGRFKVTIPARAPRKAKITASVSGGGKATVSDLSFSIIRPSK